MSDPQSSPQIVTRFAPSPTGALHVGGARTALFSWAYARGRGGRFILRFEDTDQARSSAASARSILADLNWLGIDWDEGPNPAGDDPYGDQIGEHGPYCQSQRLGLYQQAIKSLIDAGRAYEDDGAIRFRMGEDVSFTDAVYGNITFKGAELEDFVIRKADGFPTFHLAVVVDDALMDVTHVIRGQEHLSNTPKHAALYDALGYARPTWTHTPSIMNPDGSKMSKRDKGKLARTELKKAGIDTITDWMGIAQDHVAAFLDKSNDDLKVAEMVAANLGLILPEIDVADFRRSGYLPAVLNNYIALLGWNPGGDVERFGLDEFAKTFDLPRINKGNSKFDRDKLLAFNGDTLASLEPDVFKSLLHAHMTEHHAAALATLSDAQFAGFCQAYQPRSKTLETPVEMGAFFFAAGVSAYDDKAVKKNLAKNDGEGLTALKTLAQQFATIEPWTGDAAHQVMEAIAVEIGDNMGKLAQPLRVALTGAAVSPPMDVTLDILGKAATLARIDACLNHFASASF